MKSPRPDLQHNVRVPFKELLPKCSGAGALLSVLFGQAGCVGSGRNGRRPGLLRWCIFVFSVLFLPAAE